MEEKQVADTEQWSLFRQELGERVPAFAIRSIVMAVVHSSLPDDEARSDFSSLLAREEQWKNEFPAPTWGRKFPAAVSAHEGALLKAEPGLDRGLLLELLAGVAEREFMDNPELEDLFQGTRGDPLRQECRANLREGLSSLAALAEKYVLTRQESSVVVDVEVEADKLKKMPEEAVQTLRLTDIPCFHSLRSGEAE